MGFKLVYVRPHVVIVRLDGKLTQSDWDAYERDFRAMYATTQRLVMIYDMRGIDATDVGALLPIAVQKKDMLVAFKAHTCRKLFAAIVLTPHEIITNVVTNVVRLSGQVTLFYAYTTPAEVADAVGRLSRIVFQKHTPASEGSLTWGDVSPGHITVLLVFSFLRMVRYFLAHHAEQVTIAD